MNELEKLKQENVQLQKELYEKQREIEGFYNVFSLLGVGSLDINYVVDLIQSINYDGYIDYNNLPQLNLNYLISELLYAKYYDFVDNVKELFDEFLDDYDLQRIDEFEPTIYVNYLDSGFDEPIDFDKDNIAEYLHFLEHLGIDINNEIVKEAESCVKAEIDRYKRALKNCEECLYKEEYEKRLNQLKFQLKDIQSFYE